jgi:glyoxylase-like metal-dependent hydrolase (beta-lactamase superfamily II)
MPRWLVRTIVVLLVLAVVGGGAYYWLIVDGTPPDKAAAFDLNIDRLRDLADEMPGGKPAEVRVEKVASFAFPAAASVAGDDWSPLPMHALSYQIVLPESTIVLDTALAAGAGSGLGATFDDDAYARMDLALGAAAQIILTHEHADHIGGLAAYARPQAIRSKLRLTTEQVAGTARYGAFSTPTPPLFEGYPPFDYDGAIAIAPGVVLMKAPGHSPGSQIVYVQRDDGAELLFMGDIGWTLRNVLTGRSRPRLMSDLLLGEERAAVFAQLEALGSLRESEPALALVPGHEAAAIDRLIADGVLIEGFQL